MLRKLAALTLACLVVPPLAPAAGAQGYDDVVDLEILPGWRTEDGTHMAGLRIRLAPGWKTYWRAPGDAGIPPLFDWQGSQNMSGVAFHWPVPEVGVENGMRSIGYGGEVTIPVQVAVSDPGGMARMAGRVQIGICEEICIPVELSFDALLPPTSGAGRDPAIVASLVDQPLAAAEAGVGTVVCDVSPIEDGLRLVATVQMPAAHQSDVVVIEAGDPEVWVSEPRVRRTGTALTAVSELLHVDGGPFALDRSEVRITVIGGAAGAVDIRGCTAG